MATAPVLITVRPTVTANDDTAVAQVNTPVSIDVLANDTINGVPAPAVTPTLVTAPENGEAEWDGAEFVYTPGPDYCGPDSFEYEIASSCFAPVLADDPAEALMLAFQAGEIGLTDPGQQFAPSDDYATTLTIEDGEAELQLASTDPLFEDFDGGYAVVYGQAGNQLLTLGPLTASPTLLSGAAATVETFTEGEVYFIHITATPPAPLEPVTDTATVTITMNCEQCWPPGCSCTIPC